MDQGEEQSTQDAQHDHQRAHIQDPMSEEQGRLGSGTTECRLEEVGETVDRDLKHRECEQRTNYLVLDSHYLFGNPTRVFVFGPAEGYDTTFNIGIDANMIGAGVMGVVFFRPPAPAATEGQVE